MTVPQQMRSEYMEWAKTRSTARFNLATSGIMSVPMSEFPLAVDALELTAPGGYGYAPLQQRLAEHTGAPPECIVAASGTSMANYLAIASLVTRGDEIFIEQPAYALLREVVAYVGGVPTRFARSAESGFAIDPAEIEAALTDRTRLIILTNLHNPTGALIPRKTLREIGGIAQRAGIHVLVDEVYLEMLFTADAPFAFAIGAEMAYDTSNPFIVTSSLTKTYGLSGLRCGWVLASPDLATKMWRLNDFFGVNAAHPAERMAVMAFDSLQRFRDRARTLLERNRVLLNAFLDSRDDLECFRAAAGSVAFPRLMRGDPHAFVTLLRDKYETSVVAGDFFEMPQHFRIGIGGDTAELRNGLERLGAALDEFSGG